jgi:hypothetical protein
VSALALPLMLNSEAPRSVGSAPLLSSSLSSARLLPSSLADLGSLQSR